jgi:hypothetical protein
MQTCLIKILRIGSERATLKIRFLSEVYSKGARGKVRDSVVILPK